MCESLHVVCVSVLESACVWVRLQVTLVPHGLPVHRHWKSEQASGCASLLDHRKARVQVKTRTHIKTQQHKRHSQDPR